MSADGAPVRRRGPVRGTPRGHRLSRAERKLQLIEVAEKVFGEHGYQATTVDDVARQAGVTKPVIYDHFGSKEGLLSAVVRRLGEAITQLFIQAWAALPERASPQDRIRAMVHAFYSFMDARPGPFQVWAQEIAVSAIAAEAIGEMRQLHAHMIADQLAEAKEFAEIPRDSLVAVGELVVALVDVFALMRIRRPGTTADQAAEIFMALAGRGIPDLLLLLQSSPLPPTPES